ncbi:MAG: hypothetical protein JSU92_14685 [Deltaproteobacteria bacterium]|nr:MAG: hypothetical protein JSU92_14685 [Deltaproteobacteria bacterium]
MKMVMIVHYSAIGSDVTEALTKIGVRTYTKLPGIHGLGTSSEPHFDTHIWPGTNDLVLTVVDEQKAGEVMKEVGELKKKFKKEGIKAFLFSVEAVV